MPVSPSAIRWQNALTQRVPETVTEFERVAEKLSLTTVPQMLRSLELREWVSRNSSTRYVPSWLLVAYRVVVSDEDENFYRNPRKVRAEA